MNDFQSLSHTVWECKYHLVWVPKYRRKVLYGDIRNHLGGVLRELAIQRESNILEGHLMRDHLHMLISIPQKYSVAQVVGFMKGKSAIQIARTFGGRTRPAIGGMRRRLRSMRHPTEWSWYILMPTMSARQRD
jgi:putative transposase